MHEGRVGPSAIDGLERRERRIQLSAKHPLEQLLVAVAVDLDLALHLVEPRELVQQVRLAGEVDRRPYRLDHARGLRRCRRCPWARSHPRGRCRQRSGRHCGDRPPRDPVEHRRERLVVEDAAVDHPPGGGDGRGLLHPHLHGLGLISDHLLPGPEEGRLERCRERRRCAGGARETPVRPLVVELILAQERAPETAEHPVLDLGEALVRGVGEVLALASQ